MYNRILVAIDGSKMSEKALMSAFRFAKERYSRVGVLHVKKNITISESMPTEAIDKIYTEMRKEGEVLLSDAQTLADEMNVEMEPHYVVGDPAVQIVKMAEEGNYQLIIMGSRGLGSIKGLMLGSVSHKVSQLSHCPVLIIK